MIVVEKKCQGSDVRMKSTQKGKQCKVCGKQNYAKNLCLSHYQAQLKQSPRNKEFDLCRQNVERYMHHRFFVYSKFKNSRIGLTDNFNGNPIWKQRLQEMDAMFIEQIVIDFDGCLFNLESLMETLRKKCDEMDLDIETNHITHKYKLMGGQFNKRGSMNKTRLEQRRSENEIVSD